MRKQSTRTPREKPVMPSVKSLLSRALTSAYTPSHALQLGGG